MDEHSVYLSPAPLYHSAPLFYCMSTMRLGGTAIVMEQFDPEQALACIETYHVTHSQWVPTMFVRMLKLPDDVRTRYDLSSQKVAIHAAAPCSVEVKRKMIEWWGPIIDEYYAATEGMGATFINSADWLAHPGSVGKSMLAGIRILDDDGNEMPTGEVGTVWFEPPPNRPGFEYHKDAEKTRDSFNAKGWSTVGDMGYLDADGYLYLTDRRTFMIVSGGVNIYPQEAENVLIDHPKVYDVAVFGIPDAEMGERVHGVVQPTDWDDAGPELERELLDLRAVAPRALQVPEGDRLRSRAPARADRQALQAAAARPLLGQQDLAHRLSRAMEPGRLLASGRDGDIFEFGPGLVLRRAKSGRVIEGEARTIAYAREHGYPVPEDPRRARGRHRDRDGTHRRPDDDGRDAAQAVAHGALRARCSPISTIACT